MAAPAAHEPNTLHLRGVIGGAIAIALGIALSALGAYVLWQSWQAPSGAQPFGGPNTRNLPAIAPPLLEAAPQSERARYFAEKQRLIESWDWVDARAGIARIPVEEAMRIMAAAGPPPAEQR